jgi:hypothetical protein
MALWLIENQRTLKTIWLTVILAMVIVLTVAYQPPSLAGNDQMLQDSAVVVDEVVSHSMGWLVIYADDGEGNVGTMLGYRPIDAGMNSNVIVPIDAQNATPRLFAILHLDTGIAGVYEFADDTRYDMPLPDAPRVTFTVAQAS